MLPDTSILVVGALVLGGCVLTLCERLRDPPRRAPGRHPEHRHTVELVASPVTRVGGESFEMGEHRRRQRIDAASRMLNHLMSLVMWIVITIVGFHLLDIDAAFFLSSAGFLGAAVAIGGQHKVNDYLTGLDRPLRRPLRRRRRDRGRGRLERSGSRHRRPHRPVQHPLARRRRARCTSRTTHCHSSGTSRRRRRSTTLKLSVEGSPGAEEVADAIRGLAGIVGVDRRDLPRRHRRLRAAHRAGRSRRPHAQAARRPRGAAAHRTCAVRAGRRPVRRADQTAVARSAAARLRDG